MALQSDGSIWPRVVQRARSQPSLPFLTSINHDGMRTELSGTSVLNAIAKTSGALVTEAELEPGARMAVHLPWHWQRVVWTLAAWTVGVVVVEHGDPSDCDLLVASAQSALPFTERCEPWVVSLHPLGLVDKGLPNTVVDATILCRMQPDALLVDAATGDGPAIELSDGSTLTRLQALDWAIAQDGSDARILMNHASANGLAAWLLPPLHPLVGAGAIILCDGQDSEQTAKQEGATRIWK
ncbi:MAG: TIGR03089 family protein [Actinomycetota bacterium]|nr:TIGR03089 family protein [Actinomycetota bacterium]MDP2289176.1 TIGR03089 family protein [Actinomycetota bacterium]